VLGSDDQLRSTKLPKSKETVGTLAAVSPLREQSYQVSQSKTIMGMSRKWELPQMSMVDVCGYDSRSEKMPPKCGT